MFDLPANIVPLDVIALAYMIVCWAGYTVFVNGRRGSHGVVFVTDLLREDWMLRMLERELRMPDIQIVQALMRSVIFFASTAMIIIGGLLAALGGGDTARGILSNLPFAASGDAALYEFQVLVLILIFVVGFFQLSWSMRQFNYVCLLIGGAPPAPVPVKEAAAIARRGARLASRASLNFNGGMRAYYFGLATLAWVLHPLLYMVGTTLVLLAVYRRDFRSHTLRALTSLERKLHAEAGDLRTTYSQDRDAA